MAKRKIVIELDSEAEKILKKRANNELFTLEELISDILRRSVLSYNQKGAENDNIKDKYLSYFSRRTRKSRKE